MYYIFTFFLIHFLQVFAGLYSEETDEANDVEKCFTNPPCDPDYKYRTMDGSCNNLEHPTWGKTGTAYNRLCPASYEDGKSESCSNGPNPRDVSLTFFKDCVNPHPDYTAILTPMSQLMTHDIAYSEPQSDNCCSNGKAVVDDKCTSIELSRSDPSYAIFFRTCMSVGRTQTTKSINCSTARNVPVSQATSYMDMSMLYGPDIDSSNSLRTRYGGQLKVTTKDGQQYCFEGPKTFCDARSTSCCSTIGDDRTNQNPPLTAMTTVMIRNHNRIACDLAKQYPLWSDEMIFQEARFINIAGWQHILEYEVMPILTGSKMPECEYDSSVNPSTLLESTSCCLRSLHNIISEFHTFMNEDGFFKGFITVTEWFKRSDIVKQRFSDIINGLCKQPIENADQCTTPGIHQYTEKKTKLYGDDLIAIDVNRGYEHNVTKYCDLRKHLLGKKTESYADLKGVISDINIEKLKQMYPLPKDIDCYIGNHVELKESSALLGPTCTQVLIEQFRRLKAGDRHYYSHKGVCTEMQLNEINKVTVASWLCDNNIVSKVQPNAFMQVSEKNQIVPCSEIPSPSLYMWKQ